MPYCLLFLGLRGVRPGRDDQISVVELVGEIAEAGDDDRRNQTDQQAIFDSRHGGFVAQQSFAETLHARDPVVTMCNNSRAPGLIIR